MSFGKVCTTNKLNLNVILRLNDGLDRANFNKFEPGKFSYTHGEI